MVQPGEGLRDDEQSHAGRDEFDGVAGRGRALDRGQAGRDVPVQHVVQRMQHDVVGQVVAGELLGGGHEMVLRGHHHRRLGVQRDGVQPRAVGRQPEQRGVDGTLAHRVGGVGGGDPGERQRDPGCPLVPPAHPLVGRHPGDVGEGEREVFVRIRHAARLPDGRYAERGSWTPDGYPRGMASQKTSQTMKPETAAKKLNVYLPATPEEFRSGVVSRDELNALQADPPEWLRDLRRDGPHPRQVVAARLGVSNSALARNGITDALTTAEINALKAEMPEWLRRERATQAEVREEAARLKERDAERGSPDA